MIAGMRPTMTGALGGLLREGLERDCAEGVRPRRGPGRQWVRPAWGRQRSELGEEWWACQDLNLGPHPYQG
jgi:hypothetical protein